VRKSRSTANDPVSYAVSFRVAAVLSISGRNLAAVFKPSAFFIFKADARKKNGRREDSWEMTFST
jgi:hypothetical protein